MLWAVPGFAIVVAVFSILCIMLFSFLNTDLGEGDWPVLNGSCIDFVPVGNSSTAHGGRAPPPEQGGILSEIHGPLVTEFLLIVTAFGIWNFTVACFRVVIIRFILLVSLIAAAVGPSIGGAMLISSIGVRCTALGYIFIAFSVMFLFLFCSVYRQYRLQVLINDAASFLQEAARSVTHNLVSLAAVLVLLILELLVEIVAIAAVLYIVMASSSSSSGNHGQVCTDFIFGAWIAGLAMLFMARWISQALSVIQRGLMAAVIAQFYFGSETVWSERIAVSSSAAAITSTQRLKNAAHWLCSRSMSSTLQISLRNALKDSLIAVVIASFLALFRQIFMDCGIGSNVIFFAFLYVASPLLPAALVYMFSSVSEFRQTMRIGRIRLQSRAYLSSTGSSASGCVEALVDWYVRWQVRNIYDVPLAALTGESYDRVCALLDRVDFDSFAAKGKSPSIRSGSLEDDSNDESRQLLPGRKRARASIALVSSLGSFIIELLGLLSSVFCTRLVLGNVDFWHGDLAIFSIAVAFAMFLARGLCGLIHGAVNALMLYYALDASGITNKVQIGLFDDLFHTSQDSIPSGQVRTGDDRISLVEGNMDTSGGDVPGIDTGWGSPHDFN
eukprot:g4424.t1